MFELPDELVFGKTFYLASYTKDHQIQLNKKISLLQGFDEEVTLHLSGGKFKNIRTKVSLVRKYQYPGNIVFVGLI